MPTLSWSRTKASLVAWAGRLLRPWPAKVALLLGLAAVCAVAMPTTTTTTTAPPRGGVKAMPLSNQRRLPPLPRAVPVHAHPLTNRPSQ